MLFTLIKNELIKIFRRGKTWVVFGIFLLFTLFLTFVFKDSADMQKYYNSIEGKIDNYEEQIKNEEETLKYAKEDNDSDLIISCENNIESMKKELEIYKQISNNKDDPESWKSLLEKEKEELQVIIDDESIPDSEKVNELNRMKIINEYLEKNIEPIEEWEFNGINFGIDYMSVIGMVILACGIAVFMSDIVSGECTPATLKFLLVQPISRGKVLLSKFIAVTLSVILLICGVEVIMAGVLSLFEGVDAASMPTLIGTQYQWDNSTIASEGAATLVEVAGSGHIVSRGVYLLQSFGIQMLFIISCCAFIFMISCIFKSSMITMAISVVISVFASMLPIITQKIGGIAHFIFLSYGDPTGLVQGDICTMYNNPNFSITLGIAVLLVTTIVTYLIGHFVFKKKDIII